MSGKAVGPCSPTIRMARQGLAGVASTEPRRSHRPATKPISVQPGQPRDGRKFGFRPWNDSGGDLTCFNQIGGSRYWQTAQIPFAPSDMHFHALRCERDERSPCCAPLYSRTSQRLGHCDSEGCGVKSARILRIAPAKSAGVLTRSTRPSCEDTKWRTMFSAGSTGGTSATW